MTQGNLGALDPTTNTGTQLATKLETAEAALHSLHKGNARPSYAAAGMLWVKEVSATQWDLMLFDGDTDMVVAQVNPTTNTVIPLPIASGGTGAANAAAARTALGLDGAMKGDQANAVTVNQSWTAQVKATVSTSHAIWGISTDENGVRGESTNHWGVWGAASAASAGGGVVGSKDGFITWGALGFGDHAVYANGSMFASGGITASGTVQGSDVQATSDINLKTDFEIIGQALGRVNALTGVTFRWKKNGTKAAGVIAQDVDAVLPEAVGKTNDGNLTVSPLGVVGLLVEAIKELAARVEELERR